MKSGYSDTQKLIEEIKNQYNKNKFRPYIEYIQFIKYKNITPLTKIDLSFPITVLVGANGTNKSSILKALEACCPRISLGNRWFSTNIDPIRHKPPQGFIYGYMVEDKPNETPNIEIEAQVYYYKPYRKGEPDYWEVGRHLKNYMKNLPTDLTDYNRLGFKKDRWPKLRKPNPIYLTFRESISAFDKYFYYGDSNPTKPKPDDRKKVIRRSSRTLNSLIGSGKNHLNYSKKERVIENKILNKQSLDYISYILNTNYNEIKLVKHTFYNCEGYTCKFIRNSINYSEAFAGSGEFAVIRMVTAILEAKHHALVLLDEPEVSLHPGAQEKLLKFIIEQTLSKKLQVVIATHSPAFIRNLPEESIKVLVNDFNTDQTKLLKQSCPPNEAFYYIGEPNPKLTTFIVEDKLAKALIKFAIEKEDQSLKENIDIKFYSGGAIDILNNFAKTYALDGNKNIFIILDGDQRKLDQNGKIILSELPDPETLTENQILNLEVFFENFFKDFSANKLIFPKNSNETNSDKIIRNKKVLMWFKEHISFLPTNLSPEEFIWRKTNSPLTSVYSIDITTDYKENFSRLAQKLYPSSTDIDSNKIFDAQLILLNAMDKNDDDLKTIIDLIKSRS